jgi:hypothetical protein
MFRFFIKCFFITLLLAFGVLVGMQVSNEGLIKMKGYDDPNFSNALTVEKNERGYAEAEVLGENVELLDIEEKQRMLEERKAFNIFSSTGQHLSKIVKGGVDAFFNFIDRIV